jgi:hypothetical protein
MNPPLLFQVADANWRNMCFSFKDTGVSPITRRQDTAELQESLKGGMAICSNFLSISSPSNPDQLAVVGVGMGLRRGMGLPAP